MALAHDAPFYFLVSQQFLVSRNYHHLFKIEMQR